VLKRGDREVNRKQSGSIENCKYVDAGYSIFNKRLLSLVKEGEFVTLETDIFPDLIKATQLTGFVTSQRYYDLGTPKRLELIRSVLK
jgi:NDP-sugar pyrophosphorylase family protein